jgi:ATP phosphoribosyltransferase regulatory subunit HisZ
MTSRLELIEDLIATIGDDALASDVRKWSNAVDELEASLELEREYSVDERRCVAEIKQALFRSYELALAGLPLNSLSVRMALRALEQQLDRRTGGITRFAGKGLRRD